MENNKEELSMNEMINEIEKSMTKVYVGDIIKGKVISISQNEVLVNIGYMIDGVISKNELCESEEIEIQDLVKPGDEIYVYILKVNDGEGNVCLSKKMADKIKTLEKLEEYFKNDKIFTVNVSEVVKGGALAFVDGIRTFIPASHISYSFVKNLTSYLNKDLKVKIIEFVKDKEKVVLSAKEVEKEEIENKKKALWKSLKRGEKRRGKVVKIVKFGAFVDLGGIQGLIHLNDLSWKRVNNPSEILSVGDSVEVYIIDFDKDSNRVSLGLKDVSEDPWNSVEQNYKVGSVLEGTIVKLMDFGAFVELKDGIEGLVHINEISEERVLKLDDVLKVGDRTKVKIMDIDKKRRRMSLSIKEANNIVVEQLNKYNDKEEGFTLGDILKDKLKGFKFEE
ncbi:30S ribosomal protein S1 [Clostridium rectalis]|uniref:30S ribosomal protein S1 n=1 Tax=Clostridium rectalis TaxID=2040295 RepID=UPI000F632AD6|nr:30S ribosomal protein S1 [Clostridium rectalis]